MLAYKTRKWRTAGRSGEVFSDRAFQSTWDTSRAQPGTDGILTVFSGGKSGLTLGVGTSEAQRDSCAAAIDAALPGTRALRLAPPHARARQLLDVQGRSAFHLRRRRGCN
jgi:monoamine oxidase